PIGDVRPVATVQDLNAGVRKMEDGAIGFELFPLADQFERARQLQIVRIVILHRNEFFRAVLYVWTKSSNRNLDLVSVSVCTDCAWQFEELECVGERNLIHLLRRLEARKFGLVGVVFGAELYEWSILSVTHAD